MGELRALLRLALPVVLVQLGMRAMSTVDIMMIGRLSDHALAAVSVGNSWTWFITIFCIGFLMGLDPLFSQAVGARDGPAVSRTMQRGLAWVGLLTLPAMAAIWEIESVLRWTEQPDHIVPDAVLYARVVSVGTFPLLLFHLGRVALQAHSRLGALVITILLANALNAAANYALIFGHWGWPALGVEGSAWATAISRWSMAGMLFLFSWPRLGQHLMSITSRPLRHRALQWRALGRVAWIGVPVGFQISLELGAFAATTLTVGSLGATEVAGHQVSLDLASITFMIAMGLGFAGAVRVGNAVGRGDMNAVRSAARCALWATACIMLLSGIVLSVIPAQLAGLYTREANVVVVAATLLPLAGLFQLADGVQVVAIGVLRGLGDTKTALYVNVVGFWAIGFPIGFALCFGAGMGAAGMWWGLVTGLTTVGGLLLVIVRRKLRRDHVRLHVD